MRIGIIGAMNEETESLISNMNVETVTEKAQMTFNSGKLFNKEVVVVTCGIGKVNAAICTQILADNFQVDAIINVGIAGGAMESIVPGDIIIGKELIQHDFDASFFQYKIGQIPRLNTYSFPSDDKLVNLAKQVSQELKGYNVYEGIIVSGDQFVATKEKLSWLNSNFNAYACEMEGASIAHVSFLNKIPFVVIRSISDNALNDTHLEYEKFKVIAVRNSVAIIKGMLEKI
ncbi:adenosylhomocysteine nucleosidase [Hathewaya proteolytica DSM 3090]|uniref:adenosylhomocysteine nucleosidase n=1 Tax=Hathewaya proteolytica DSM 3090 TaxID=1121331 RepID=A0A1M6L6L8_9CLOT|nr:5'-methylthioadenosine/adenosylhomocysteine nucleosidase [Hathewaya proteolytica]SHJ66845.1 adenosylhomocysteine nucleosidase [Hathewaya proteolytica DSM 3090]